MLGGSQKEFRRSAYFCKSQTSTATPAQPGDLPYGLVEGQDRYEETKLGLKDQLFGSYLAGVNVGRIYPDFTDLDPLFEADVFAYRYKKSLEVEIDPDMIETALHRRALAILGQ